MPLDDGTRETPRVLPVGRVEEGLRAHGAHDRPGEPHGRGGRHAHGRAASWCAGAAGADVSRIIMGHMERSGLERARLSELARRGCYLEYDWFGEVRPTWPYGRVDVPSDGERIKIIASLIHEGFLERVLISHDVCFKTRLASYGGPGYAHIVKYVSHWMQALGIAAAEVETILIGNARRILQIS